MADERPVGGNTAGGSSETGLVYSRVLLKVSGEALMGGTTAGLDPALVGSLADEVIAATTHGVEVAIVIGGGNFCRGVRADELGIDRVTADHVGMLATVMNGLALQDALERRGADTRLCSAIAMNAIAEPYIRRRAIRHLERKRTVIFAAGTGAPFFTTDSAAALRALEIGADVMMKATMVDGIYTADPKCDPDAELLRFLDHRELLDRGLRVMDATAISLAMENDLPVLVFGMSPAGNIRKALMGEPIGSVVRARKANAP